MNPIPLTKYFRHAREEVLALIPATARRILDVGCGAGVLGERLRQRQPCEVWGIECDPDAAREARGRLDHVLEASVAEAAPGLPSAHFDTLIAADVLEHLADPWGALRALAPSLAPDAMVVLSLPNVQYHRVVADLLRGRFTYAPEGILDHTHLRFFTRASIEDLVCRAGFEDACVIPFYSNRRDRRAAERGRPPADLRLRSDLPVGDFYPAQFFVVARSRVPPPDTSSRRVSIVMLTFNRLDVTQQAVASVRASTRQPYELIVVDNGSSDGTPAYLDQLEREGVRVLRNTENRGVAAGWNQGLRVATGDCLMVLNNDVIVAGDWLERMTRAAYEIPGVGLVGCRASDASGPQRLSPDYQDVRDFPLFARRYAALADHSWFELPRVVGIAMLWRREVFERVGEFDEQFSPANFEDDDYSMRVLAAGYRNVIANDVFIHHIGAASQAPIAGRVKTTTGENTTKFVAKWGAAAAPVLATRYASADEHIALLQPEQYRLPAWAIHAVPARRLAQYCARVGRRLARHGWRAEARAAFRQSLRHAVTIRGLAGLLWSLTGRARSREAPALGPSRPA